MGPRLIDGLVVFIKGAKSTEDQPLSHKSDLCLEGGGAAFYHARQPSADAGGEVFLVEQESLRALGSLTLLRHCIRERGDL